MTTQFLAVALFIGAAPAVAKQLDWSGTLDLELAAFERIRIAGSGVATVNGSAGGSALDGLRIAGGLSGAHTLPLTDPDVATLDGFPNTGLRIDATLGTGTFSGVSAAPPLAPPATLPIRGLMRLCNLTAGVPCDGSNPVLTLPNTTNNGATGIGVGGFHGIGGFGSHRMSLESGPWTVGTASAVNQTQAGGFVTATRAGFIHGAASNTGTTATPSGVVQLVSAQTFRSRNILRDGQRINSLFTTLTLHFIPEPGRLLLLGAGALALGLLGRNRARR